jgi:hypothetical protein
MSLQTSRLQDLREVLRAVCTVIEQPFDVIAQPAIHECRDLGIVQTGELHRLAERAAAVGQPIRQAKNTPARHSCLGFVLMRLIRRGGDDPGLDQLDLLHADRIVPRRRI